MKQIESCLFKTSLSHSKKKSENRARKENLIRVQLPMQNLLFFKNNFETDLRSCPCLPYKNVHCDTCSVHSVRLLSPNREMRMGPTSEMEFILLMYWATPAALQREKKKLRFGAVLSATVKVFA